MAAWKAALLVCLVKFGKQLRERKVNYLPSQVKGANPAPASAPSFNPLRTVNVVCLILNDLNPDTRAFAFESARKFVNSELRPNTYIGIFSLNASGLRPVFAFSDNRENLLEAVGLAAVNQPCPRFGCLFLVFNTDFLACHQPQRADILADAILEDRYVFGFEIGDELAVRVAHDEIEENFPGGGLDDDIRKAASGLWVRGIVLSPRELC